MSDDIEKDFGQANEGSVSKLQVKMHQVLTNMARGIVDPSSKEAERIARPSSAMEKVASIIKNNLGNMKDDFKIVLFQMKDDVSHLILTDADDTILYDSMKDTGQEGHYDAESGEYKVAIFTHERAQEVSFADFKSHYIDGLSQQLKAAGQALSSKLDQNPTQ